MSADDRLRFWLQPARDLFFFWLPEDKMERAGEAESVLRYQCGPVNMQQQQLERQRVCLQTLRHAQWDLLTPDWRWQQKQLASECGCTYSKMWQRKTDSFHSAYACAQLLLIAPFVRSFFLLFPPLHRNVDLDLLTHLALGLAPSSTLYSIYYRPLDTCTIPGAPISATKFQV